MLLSFGSPLTFDTSSEQGACNHKQVSLHLLGKMSGRGRVYVADWRGALVLVCCIYYIWLNLEGRA